MPDAIKFRFHVNHVKHDLLWLSWLERNESHGPRCIRGEGDRLLMYTYRTLSVHPLTGKLFILNFA